MAGRKPNPTYLNVVKGNPGKRPRNKNEPKPTAAGSPKPPAHLSKVAKEAWTECAKMLLACNIFMDIDQLAFEQCCEAYAELIYLREDISDNGNVQVVITQTGSRVEKARPQVAMYSDADRRFRAWCSEFGLTPSARTRLSVKKPEASDPSEAYF